MHTRTYGLLLALAALGALGTARVGLAQAVTTPNTPETSTTNDEGVEARYAEQVFAGVQATVRRDSASALEALREAASLLPERPEAYCRTGDAQRMAGALVEAVLAYESCTRFADSAEDATYGDVGRVGQAITLERIPGRADEARALYSRLLTDSSREVVVALAEARIRAMDARIKLDTRYAPVRQRIADREHEGKRR